eukprot:1076552-Pyramimonas_sp.AAC.1
MEDDVVSHLRSALKAAKDPHMRQRLEQQIKEAQEASNHSSAGSVLQALQRADGALRDVNNRHDQSVQAVARLQKNLAAAQAKEQKLAIEVAEAEAVRKQAAA